VPLFARGTLDSEPQEREDTARVDFDGDALQTPLEELLDKNRHHDTSSISPPDRDESATFKQPRRAPSAALGDAGDADKAPPTQGLEISFEDLFAGGSILDDQESSSTVMPTESAAAKPPATKGQAESAPELPRETHSEEEASFFAVEDILRQEFESPYASSTTETSPDGGDGELPEHPSIRNDVNKVEQPLPPEKMAAPGVDVPYVDIQEILEQTALDGGTHLIEDQGAMDFNETKTDSATGLDEPLRITSSYSRGDSTNGAKSDGAEGGPIQPPGSRARDGFSAPPSQPFAGGVGERESRGRSDSGPRRSRREDDRERLLIAGLRHYKNQRFQEAIAEFENAIRLYPDFKEAYSILGNAYFRNRMFDDAAKAYARVKEMDPYDTTAYENMGVIYANRGDFLDAMKEWQRVLEIDPNRDDIRRKIERASRMVTRQAVA
jgi:TolA-binding protein